jgi:hypothetical protein
MHNTLNPNISGHYDEYRLKNNMMYHKGWTFHNTSGILSLHIKIDNNLIPVIVEERTDVSSHYNNDILKFCGWSVTTPIVSCMLVALIDNNIVDVFKLNHLLNTTLYNFNITNKIPSLVVVDNFYEDPYSVREFALSKEFKYNPNYHKGKRTDETYLFPGMKERFEQLMGRKIKDWTKYGVHGCFQYCIAGDTLVYHQDLQDYAGVLFLTPNAPPESGTKLFRSKATKTMSVTTDEDHDKAFSGGFLDKTQFDEVDTVGNVFNRLVLFNSRMIHAAAEYFGTTKENGRLFQLFFFDLE